MSQELKYSDSTAVEMIKAGGKDFEEISMVLFRQFSGFIPQIKSKLHLSQHDIQDAYSDALVKMIRQVRDGSFRADSKLSSYFYRIFYNTGVDVSRKNTSNKNMQTTELSEFNAREKDLLALIEKKDEARLVIKVIDSMSDVCKKILMEWGYYGYNMTEIADRCQLKNPESARSMKYKCLKSLRELLNNKMYDL